jgi:hypothetical protein
MTQRRALGTYAGGQKILFRASGNTSTLAYVARIVRFRMRIKL